MQRACLCAANLQGHTERGVDDKGVEEEHDVAACGAAGSWRMALGGRREGLVAGRGAVALGVRLRGVGPRVNDDSRGWTSRAPRADEAENDAGAACADLVCGAVRCVGPCGGSQARPRACVRVEQHVSNVVHVLAREHTARAPERR